MTKSKLWDYFEETTIEGSSGYQYKAQDCPYKNKGRNFTTLSNHLQNKHAEIFSQIHVESSSKRPHAGDIMKYVVAKKQKTFLENFDEKVIDFFSKSSLPLRFIDDVNFRDFVGFLNPNAVDILPKRNAITAKLNKRVVESQNKIKDLISAAKYISISCDIWTQKNYSASFIGINVQFYNFTTNMINNFALDLAKIEQPHTATVIADSLSKSLSFYMDSSQIIRCVTDAGANIKAIFRKSNELRDLTSNNQDDEESDISNTNQSESESESSDDEENELLQDQSKNFNISEVRRTTCIAHLLNTVAKNAFDKSGSDIFLLKHQILKFIKQISMSAKKTEFLVNLTDKCLVKFAQTRWNSLFNICQRLLIIKESLISLCTQFGIIIPFSWLEVEALKSVLSPIETMSSLIQGDGVTKSKVIPSFYDLKDKLNALENTIFEADIKNFITILDKKTDFIHNESNPEFDPIYLMTSLLDPKESLKLTDIDFLKYKNHLINYFRGSSNSEVPIIREHSSQQRRSFTQISAPNNMMLIQLNDYINSIDSGNFDFSNDSLSFWSQYFIKYPLIYEKAIQMLSIMASSASSERMFSLAGLFSVGRRSRIKPNQLRTRTLSRYNAKISEF